MYGIVYGCQMYGESVGYGYAGKHRYFSAVIRPLPCLPEMRTMLEAHFDSRLGAFHLSINLVGEAGKTTVLLGESGAGKTTVLRLLAGLLHPDQGQIALNDVVYFDSDRHICIPPQERPVGYVFQDYVLFPHMTVF